MEQQHIWDSLDEPHAIFGLLFLLSNKLETIGGTYLDGLTTKQWAFLAVLTTFFTEPPTITAIAGPLGTSHQNVKQIALRMEKKGFVRLEKDPADSRATRVHLTQQAARYSREHERRDQRFLDTMFGELSPATLSAVKQGLLTLYATLEKMKQEDGT